MYFATTTSILHTTGVQQTVIVGSVLLHIRTTNAHKKYLLMESSMIRGSIPPKGVWMYPLQYQCDT